MTIVTPQHADAADRLLNEATRLALDRVESKWSLDRLQKCFPEPASTAQEQNAANQNWLQEAREECLRVFRSEFEQRWTQLRRDFAVTEGLERLQQQGACQSNAADNNAEKLFTVEGRIQSALAPVCAEEHRQLQQELSTLMVEQEKLRAELATEMDRLDAITKQMMVQPDADGVDQHQSKVAAATSLPVSLKRAMDSLTSILGGGDHSVDGQTSLAQLIQRAMDEQEASAVESQRP